MGLLMIGIGSFLVGAGVMGLLRNRMEEYEIKREFLYHKGKVYRLTEIKSDK